ncbi:MAG: hypothetical protein KA205_06060 [Acidobacteria bacterium]|nr:hypothetical protein [Acidobacteriota bacterium]
MLALLTLAGQWRLDVMRRDGRQAAAATNNDLRMAEQGLTELRAAQAGYLAVGQNADEWMNRATAVEVQLESAIANLSSNSNEPDARAHYQAAAALVTEIESNDKKARGFVSTEQALVASDVLFQEGAEAVRKLALELSAARDIEMASFEHAAVRLGWMNLGANGAAFAIGLLLVFLAGRSRAANATAEPASTGLNLHASSIGENPNENLNQNQNPGTPEPRNPGTPVDLFTPPPVDLTSAAELCVDLGRILDGRDLPGLMARAAGVLEAKGLVLWVSEGSVLRPSVAHGYSDRVLQRMGTLPIDGDNVTSLAFRSLQPQVVRGSFDGHGALAVPLITSSGCVGVLAAEVQGAKPGDTRFAVARMIAAQLSTIVGPGSSAANQATGH